MPPHVCTLVGIHYIITHVPPQPAALLVHTFSCALGRRKKKASCHLAEEAGQEMGGVGGQWSVFGWRILGVYLPRTLLTLVAAIGTAYRHGVRRLRRGRSLAATISSYELIANY